MRALRWYFEARTTAGCMRLREPIRTMDPACSPPQIRHDDHHHAYGLLRLDGLAAVHRVSVRQAFEPESAVWTVQCTHRSDLGAVVSSPGDNG